MRYGDRIARLREKRGLTQEELAEKIGISRAALSHYEKNRREPDLETFKRIADFFEVSTDYLLGSQLFVAPKETGQKFVRIPIIGEIRAGYGLLAEQNIIGYSMVARGDVPDGEYFFLQVKGDSMAGDNIHDGYRVLVRRQDWVKNGKIAVVLINGDEATLKRVYPQDGIVILQSSNPDYPPKMLPADEVRIQGQVVKVEFDM